MDVFAYVAARMLSNAHTARSGLLQCNKCHVGGRVTVTFGRTVWQSGRNSHIRQNVHCVGTVDLMQVLGGWQACFKGLCLFFTFSGTCIVIYLLNKDQQDPLLFINLFE